MFYLSKTTRMLIVLLGRYIGRIAVKERILFVIGSDQLIEAHVLDCDELQSLRPLTEVFIDILWSASALGVHGKRCPFCSEALREQIKIKSSSLDIVPGLHTSGENISE